ncbi:hypothetical protein AYW79_01595 [Ferroacidibacillus organovorans]|uniref:N-acetyltransferase domain-containing protein n=2 Tax=Ferroacidibacillus organovorans TaxID=1765683 RepID=A0A853KIG5_9BACL|nr:hypothetical protein AYJ22_00995 [Ferroacidibacillus organovorans]OAG95160.1 hypothetical protein AYW79_01595 [Ferroacidibacillus organovorans]
MVVEPGLSEDAYASVRDLAKRCQEHDGLTLKLNETFLRTRPAYEVNDLLYYAGDRLVGYLGLHQFQMHEVELTGMVDPAYRRRGIFSALVAEARQEIDDRGASVLIFISPQESNSGKCCLQSLGASYSFSEYHMLWDGRTRKATASNVTLRAAEREEDLHRVALMTAECFEMEEEDVHSSITEARLPGMKRYLIEMGEEAIGTIAVNEIDQREAFLFGFCVLEAFRGKGWGRAALTAMIGMLSERGFSSIALEVAAENRHALSLYEGCGFSILRANDYFKQSLE